MLPLYPNQTIHFPYPNKAVLALCDYGKGYSQRAINIVNRKKMFSCMFLTIEK